jgi:ribonuclease P protein component
MLRERRLRKSSDFAMVRRVGRSWADDLLVLAARRNEMPRTRYGFVVGRRVGNAVTRNRIKRRLRGAVTESCVVEGWDITLIARNRAANAKYHELKESLNRLMVRAGILDQRSEVAR